MSVLMITVTGGGHGGRGCFMVVRDFTPSGHGVPAVCCGELWGTVGSMLVFFYDDHVCSLKQFLYSPQKIFLLFSLAYFVIF